MSRTGQQRIDAIPAAMARTAEFRERIAAAHGDVMRCADIMAEAIAMDRDARGLSPIGRNGKATVEFEQLQACYCLDDARDAYMIARMSHSAARPICEEQQGETI